MHTMRDIIDMTRLYETDEHAWMQEQIGFLKERRLDQIDASNLVRYLEEMTISQRRELRSRFEVLLVHLLKFAFQPSKRTASWTRTIGREQDQITTLLSDVPSLAQYQQELYASAYQLAVRQAARETGLPPTAFPALNPWTIEQALTFEH